MRQLARWAAFTSLGGLAVTYILAKRDFFLRFDGAATLTTSYLAGHWPYWVIMVAFTGLAGLFFWLEQRASSSAHSKSDELRQP